MSIIKRYPVRAGLVILLAGLFFFVALIASRPDHEITFVRQAGSAVSREVLADALHFTANWPLFHHETVEVKRLDPSGNPLPPEQQYIEKDAIVRITVEPKKQSWKRFHLDAHVTEYERGSSMALTLLADSSERLPKVFEPLNWRIELLPRKDGREGTWVRSSTDGQTRNWRARFFGTVSRNILMHQVSYVNFTKLLELTQVSRSATDGVAPIPAEPLEAPSKTRDSAGQSGY